jgi:hypothetical protein
LSFISQANFHRVLDHLVEFPCITGAASVIGMRGSKGLFGWMKMSQAGDQRFLVRGWPTKDSPPTPFHELVLLSRRMNAAVMDGVLRQQALRGILRPVIHQGQLQYRQSPRWIGVSDFEMEGLGFSPSDRYERDAKGNALPLLVREDVPSHLRIRVAAGLIPHMRESQHITQDVRVNGHVLVLSGAEPGRGAVGTSGKQVHSAREPEPVEADYSDILPLLTNESEPRTGADPGHNKRAPSQNAAPR